MAKLSMNEMTTYRWSFEEDVARYVEAGIEGIGVWRQKLADFGEDKGIELLADSQLTVSNLLWAGGFTGSDGRTFRESVGDGEEAIRLAAAMQAACLVVYSGGRNGHTQNHAWRLIHSALTELIPLAEHLDVTLAIEPMHPGCAGDWTFLTDLDRALDLIHSLESPQIKLAFDTYHLGHDPTVIDRISEIVGQVAVVHLGDSRCPPDGEQNRCWLGDGTVPLREIVEALLQSGYDAHFDVVLMGEEVESSSYTELLEQSKWAFAEMCGTPRSHGVDLA